MGNTSRLLLVGLTVSTTTTIRTVMASSTMMMQSQQNKEQRHGMLRKLSTDEITEVIFDSRDPIPSKDGKVRHPPAPKNKPPVIFDTDYGPFIDDVFALGLIINSNDLIDLRAVITTSEDPTLSAKCVAKHLDIAGTTQVPVFIGSEFPDYAERGGVCAIPGLIGFSLEDECNNVDLPIVSNGVQEVRDLLMDSDRDDWWYIVVGGQTSIKDLVLNHPRAAKKIDTLVIMGGDWCAGFDPYPNVSAPTDETNIACDPTAANILVDASKSPIKNIYYVPVEVAAEIGGDDYIKIVESANSGTNPGATATIDFYKAWSAAARANPDVLVHLEALTYDPETESTPQFDACAVMLALELLDDKTCEDRIQLYNFDAVHFLEAGEGKAFPDKPRSAFSLLTTVGDKVSNWDLPEDQCPELTPFTFETKDTPGKDMSVKVALGYTSPGAKGRFFSSMAQRMAGDIPKCA